MAHVSRTGRLRVLDELADRGEATVSELVQRLPMHPFAVQEVCRELDREGYIRPTTRGAYVLTAEGEQLRTETVEAGG